MIIIIGVQDFLIVFIEMNVFVHSTVCECGILYGFMAIIAGSKDEGGWCKIQYLPVRITANLKYLFTCTIYFPCRTNAGTLHSLFHRRRQNIFSFRPEFIFSLFQLRFSFSDMRKRFTIKDLNYQNNSTSKKISEVYKKSLFKT